jgi:hypothetical protein
MKTLFEVRFEGQDEERVYLISGSGEDIWTQLQVLIEDIDDLDDFDCLTLKRLEKTVFLKNSMGLSPCSE